MPEKSRDDDLPNTPCRFSIQSPGFTVYIGAEIANDVLKVLPLGKKFLAVFDPEKEILTIQKYRIQS